MAKQLRDYRKIEEDTGLDAGVVDIKNLNPASPVEEQWAIKNGFKTN